MPYIIEWIINNALPLLCEVLGDTVASTAGVPKLWNAYVGQAVGKGLYWAIRIGVEYIRRRRTDYLVETVEHNNKGNNVRGDSDDGDHPAEG